MRQQDARPLVLIAGATGYIGRRLSLRLLEEGGARLRLLARNPAKLTPSIRERAETALGDVLRPATLRKALAGVDTAYYLVHSMGAGTDYPELDRRGAENFREACLAENVKRIIYLGGLGEKATASRHLLSRLETGEILGSRPGRLPLLWFRAGVIIGSGSASFEMLRNLVQKLPLLITPSWVSTPTQPIAVADVIDYLAAGLTVDISGRTQVDIGAGKMSFRDMLLEAGRVMGLRRRLIPVPFFTPRLSSYWLILMTPVNFRIARALVQGLKSPTLVRNREAGRLFPGIRPRSYAAAVRDALAEIERDQVVSRWCDSSAGATCDLEGADRIDQAIYRDRVVRSIGDADPDRVFAAVCSVGGESGWFRHTWMWRLRGRLDKLLGGPGLGRGRRRAESLRVGDSLDFWKVADLRPGRRLLLYSQMKLPGQAWLELTLEDRNLGLTAHFWPRGLSGRLYWWLVKPFHGLIFPATVSGILRRAAEPSDEQAGAGS